MHELTGFEQQLAVALEDYAGPRQQVDARAIARRVAATRRARSMQPRIAWRGAERRTLLRFALVAALVATALVAGILVGSSSQRPQPAPSSAPITGPSTLPDVDPSSGPNPLHDTFSCGEAQAAAARTTTTWMAGPAPADPRTAENAWIAVWGGDEVPELFLIDPTTGEPCSLARFDAYSNPRTFATPEGPLGWVPPRGPLVWSPDGQALAFIVIRDRDAVRDLYVWSVAGLAGPLMSQHGHVWPGTPSWSPDGSQLAAPDIGNTGLRDITSVWIVSQDGRPPRPIASGCACHLGQVQWSASGRSIATTTRPSLSNDEGIVAGSVDGNELHVVPILASPVGSDITEQVLGFVDDQTLLLVNPSPRRFTARPIGGGADRDLGPTRITTQMTEQWPLNLAPDRSAWLYNRVSSLGVLEIATGAQAILAGATDGMPAGWAPNSRAIGYVMELQRADQGVWVIGRDGTSNRRVAAGAFVLAWEPAASAFPWQPVWPVR